jgi:adenylate cyclase
VKMIGDAAMLVSPDTDALLDAALALVAAAEAEGEGFPQLRAGVAHGPAVPRAGDWYGRPVNLASRITAIARPGSVLASEEVHDAAANGYRWSFAGSRRLRGIGHEVRLFRVRGGAEEEGERG